MPEFPVHHQHLELTQIHVHQVGDVIQPSHPVVPFSSCLQSSPASGSFPMSQFFTSGGQSVEASAPCNSLYSLWNSLGQNTRVGSCYLLQGISPTQGWNPGIPHCRQILYQLSYQGSPVPAKGDGKCPCCSVIGNALGKSQFVVEVKWSASHSVMSDSLLPYGLYSPWNFPGQNTGVGSLSLLQGIFPTQVSSNAGGFFTNWAIREAQFVVDIAANGIISFFFMDE